MIEIRELRALDAMHDAVEIQKVYWGDDPLNLIPAHMLFSLANYGGHVLAAYDGDLIVGVLIGFLGTSELDSRRPAMANLVYASKRMVVLPDYREQGVGYRLKLRQRDLANKQGVRLINWTFDPLLARNAHLNVRKLGVVSQRYMADFYAAGEDRLLADWWVTSRRVEERINGSRGDLTLRQYMETGAPIVNRTQMTDDGLLLPGDDLDMPHGSFALLEIPTEYVRLAQDNPALAQTWRLNVRQAFQTLLQERFVITDFLHEVYDGRDRAFYLLSFDMGFDFSRN